VSRGNPKGIAFSLVVIIALLLGGLEFGRRWSGRWTGGGVLFGHSITWMHYGDEVLREAELRSLPPAYFLALIELESGGRKPAGKRFESHVMQRLQNVQKGKRKRLENITKPDLEGASNEALRNLATSWGPFQLMGYKCIGLDVQIRDLRGDQAISLGIQWIDDSYGDALREGRFQDAFHLHNTGQPYPTSGPPKTYHPNYVQRGMALMNQFEVELLEREKRP
jgi:hypothetical protein